MGSDKIVYALADNIVSGLGITTAENTDNVLAEKTGIAPVNDASLYPEPFLAQRIDDKRLTNLPNYTATSSYHRLERIMIASVSEALCHTTVNPSANDVIFIISSTKGNIGLLADANGHVPNDAYLDEMAKRVAGYFKQTNTPIVVSNACISGVLASVVAMRLLKTGKYNTAIIVGGDELNEFVISGFESFKSVSASPCKPYDANRDGLSMGEGVATLIVSTNAALAGEQPIMLAGGASSNDANHISGPSRTGDGLYFSMKNAMAEANVKAEDIDMIDAHGTATVYNDEMESKAIGLANLNKAPLLSLKGYFGHTLGASGLLETIICIEAIKRQMRPRTLNFEQLGVPVEVNVSNSTQPAKLQNIIKTASGFGGCNAALVISTKEAGKAYKAQPVQTQTVGRCTISNQKVCLNGRVAYDGSNDEDFGQFIRNAFKSIAQPYMKFPKMDDQCKLALTATEFLMKDVDSTSYGEEDTALLLACKASSLGTDLRHQDVISVKDPYMPSPAIFVYTLANIMEGEICIRHKIKGENLCLIASKADSMPLLREQANLLLTEGRAKRCIIGFADYLQGHYQAELELIAKQ